MYGLRKVDKTGCNLRPVVSCTEAPSYKVAKMLYQLLEEVGKSSLYNVKNCREFVNFAREIKLPKGYVLIALDVVLHFTNIPKELVLSILEDSWEGWAPKIRAPKEVILEMIKFCFDASYFTFDGEMFLQTDGSRMDNPASPILAALATVAELKGRRIGLIAALLLHGAGECIGSLVSNYWGLLVCKFVVGFGFSGQLALLFTYLGEFQPCRVRDRLLAWLELAWVCGLMIVAGLGWAIIPLDINYHSETTYFFFNSWNLYLLLCSLLSPALALWLIFLPETPKYLAETGQHEKLLQLLGDIYHENTKCPRQQFLDRLTALDNPGMDDLLAGAKKNYESKRKTFGQMLRQSSHQTRELLQFPYLKTTILMAICTYAVFASYFTLIYWLPEIFRRYSEFEELFPKKIASVCTISDELYSSNATLEVEVDYSDCRNKFNESIYFHNMILGAACVPVALWLPLFVDKFGYKLHLVAASLSSAALAFGLLFVETSTQNLIIACLFHALTSICVMIVSCIVVELYPTHLRVTASAFASVFGRAGALLGISMVGYLIDEYCLSLILMIGIHLVVAGISGIFIPIHKSKAKYEKRQRMMKKSKESNRPV